MIIDLSAFIAEERPIWEELAKSLDRLDADAGAGLDLDGAKRLHYLYQRTSADLAKVSTFAAAPEIRTYLESLVQRAYGEIHETRKRPHRLRFKEWFAGTFPRTVRRHAGALWLAVIVTMIGALIGGLALTLDPEAKAALMPWAHLQMSPSERVEHEETEINDYGGDRQAAFSSQLMTHNTQVSILTMSLGLTFGLGTLIMLFYNGMILGAVAADYILAGQSTFLVGWLLPHGSVEIPAILLAGQAGFVLAGALIGWGRPESMRVRLRMVGQDVVTLIGGVAVLLVWAGLVEAFLSQYHEPVLPYWVKILFGAVELALLIVFLLRSGRRGDDSGKAQDA